MEFLKRRDIQILILMVLIFISINFLFPQHSGRVYMTTLDYFIEMLMILPAVFILMGLFQAWVSRDFIQKHLGAESGMKGMFISFLFGTLPTGPLYVAFPIAAGLLQKGARITNITVFLGAWAATKLPQIMVEIKFLGVAFTLVLQALTIISVFSIGLLMERIMKNETIEVEAPDEEETESEAKSEAKSEAGV